jgi:hypothetical protein
VRWPDFGSSSGMKTSLLAFALLSSAALAQTTGVPGINDLTVNWTGSGSTSCTSMCFPNGNTTIAFDVSMPTGAIAILAFNFCGCAPCSLPGPSNACAPAIPATACGGSNQSLDISVNAACGPIVFIPVATSTAGTVGATITIPPIPGPPCASAVLGVQGIVIDPCGLGVFAVPGPFVLTQAYTLQF